MRWWSIGRVRTSLRIGRLACAVTLARVTLICFHEYNPIDPHNSVLQLPGVVFVKNCDTTRDIELYNTGVDKGVLAKKQDLKTMRSDKALI